MRARYGLSYGAQHLRRWRLLSAIFAASLQGCVVGPDYQSASVSLPSRWSASSFERAPITHARIGSWWQSLGDPTLTQLVDNAVASNLDVSKAKAKIREARAAARQSGAALLPGISGSGSAQRSVVSASANGFDVPYAPTNLFKLGFDASWEIDLFGSNRRALEAAVANVEATQDDLDNTLLSLVGDVVATYIEARGYQARIALAKQTSISQRSTASLSQSRFAAGSSAQSDVAKARAQAATTEATLPSLRESLATNQHRLAVLLGQEPRALAVLLQNTVPIPRPRQRLMTGIPADILRARPDVRAAERRLAQATAKIGQAEAGRYPSVTLNGSISTSAQTIGDLGRLSSLGWSYGPSVSIPVFDGGKLQEGVIAARAQRDQTHFAFHVTVLTALEDVENALIAYNMEAKRLRKLSLAVRDYRLAQRLSRSLYENGSTGFLEVLDAERSLFSAEDTLVQSRVKLSKNYVALAKALGRGWEGTVDSSSPALSDDDPGPRLEAGLNSRSDRVP